MIGKVFTEAAIRGKVDKLPGGTEKTLSSSALIPAGTGLTKYRSVEIVDTEKKDEDIVDSASFDPDAIDVVG